MILIYMYLTLYDFWKNKAYGDTIVVCNFFIHIILSFNFVVGSYFSPIKLNIKVLTALYLILSVLVQILLGLTFLKSKKFDSYLTSYKNLTSTKIVFIKFITYGYLILSIISLYYLYTKLK
jgi:hypothetical protein